MSLYGVLGGGRDRGVYGVLFALCGAACVALWGESRWNSPGLIATLVAVALGVDALSRYYHDARPVPNAVRSVFPVALAAVLLGPAPAALIGGSAALVDALLKRARPSAVLANTVTLAITGLAGGVLADRWVYSFDTIASAAAGVAIVFAMTVFDGLLVAGYLHLVGTARAVETLRGHFSLLPRLVPAAVTVIAVAYGYTVGGLGVLLPFVTALVLARLLVLRIEATQGKLRTERDINARYLQMVATAVVSVDPDLRVTLANRRAHELFGLVDPVGRDWISLQRAGREERERYRPLLSGECDEASFELPLGRRIASWHATVVRDEAGLVTGLLLAGEDVTDRREAERRMEFLAYNDSLTGLPNAVRFGQLFPAAIEASLTAGAAAALLLVDLDDFKRVNDTYGHEVGDRVLAEASMRLRAVKGPADLLARSSSDEFLVWVPDLGVALDDVAGARRAAAAAAEAISRTFELAFPAAQARGPVHVSVSVSMAIFPLDAVQPDELQRVAEASMQGIKQRAATRGY